MASYGASGQGNYSNNPVVMANSARGRSILKQVETASTIAWCPLASNPWLLAAGTVSGTIDDSFQTSSRLNIFDANLSDDCSHNMRVVGQAKIKDADFVRVSWGAKGSSDSSMSLGVIAGGMSDGTIALWNASAIIDRSNVHPITTSCKHASHVTGLAFHPMDNNLMASGCTDSEILVWDINRLDSPTSSVPGPPTPGPHSSVSDIAWNEKVPHILASSSSSGHTTVWDLRQKRALVRFTESTHMHSPVTTLAWDPNHARQLIIGYAHPVAEIWDLRHTMTPTHKLEGGHSKGILSVAWSPHDSNIIQTTGEDAITCMWSGQGELLDSFQDSATTFCSKWNPSIPGILAGSTYEGKVTVRSVSNTGGHVPAWKGRPMGAVFGFGSKLVSFGNGVTTGSVRLSKISTEPEFVELASGFTNFANSDLPSFCSQKAQACHGDEGERTTWEFLQILFDPNSKVRFLERLGFKSEVSQSQEFASALVSQNKPSGSLVLSPLNVHQSEDISDEDFFNNLSREERTPDAQTDDGSFGFESTLTRQSKDTFPASSPAKIVSEMSPDTTEDQQINDALIAGNITGAVRLCMIGGRHAEALLLASISGPQLQQQVQADFVKGHSKRFIHHVAACIASKDISGYIERSDLKRWKETLALIITYEQANFQNVVRILTRRLEKAKMLYPAMLASLVAADVDGAVSLWKTLDRSKRGVAQSHILQSEVEKLFVMSQATSMTTRQPIGAVASSLYDEYAGLLSAQGQMSMALNFLHLTGSADNTLAYRIYNSVVPQPNFAPPRPPFVAQSVYGISSQSDSFRGSASGSSRPAYQSAGFLNSRPQSVGRTQRPAAPTSSIYSSPPGVSRPGQGQQNSSNSVPPPPRSGRPSPSQQGPSAPGRQISQQPNRRLPGPPSPMSYSTGPSGPMSRGSTPAASGYNGPSMPSQYGQSSDPRQPSQSGYSGPPIGRSSYLSGSPQPPVRSGPPPMRRPLSNGPSPNPGPTGRPPVPGRPMPMLPGQHQSSSMQHDRMGPIVPGRVSTVPQRQSQLGNAPQQATPARYPQQVPPTGPPSQMPRSPFSSASNIQGRSFTDPAIVPAPYAGQAGPMPLRSMPSTQFQNGPIGSRGVPPPASRSLSQAQPSRFPEQSPNQRTSDPQQPTPRNAPQHGYPSGLPPNYPSRIPTMQQPPPSRSALQQGNSFQGQSPLSGFPGRQGPTPNQSRVPGQQQQPPMRGPQSTAQAFPGPASSSMAQQQQFSAPSPSRLSGPQPTSSGPSPPWMPPPQRQQFSGPPSRMPAPQQQQSFPGAAPSPMPVPPQQQPFAGSVPSRMPVSQQSSIGPLPSRVPVPFQQSFPGQAPSRLPGSQQQSISGPPSRMPVPQQQQPLSGPPPSRLPAAQQQQAFAAPPPTRLPPSQQQQQAFNGPPPSRMPSSQQQLPGRSPAPQQQTFGGPPLRMAPSGQQISTGQQQLPSRMPLSQPQPSRMSMRSAPQPARGAPPTGVPTQSNRMAPPYPSRGPPPSRSPPQPYASTPQYEPVVEYQQVQPQNQATTQPQYQDQKGPPSSSQPDDFDFFEEPPHKDRPARSPVQQKSSQSSTSSRQRSPSPARSNVPTRELLPPAAQDQVSPQLRPTSPSNRGIPEGASSSRSPSRSPVTVPRPSRSPPVLTRSPQNGGQHQQDPSLGDQLRQSLVILRESCSDSADSDKVIQVDGQLAELYEALASNRLTVPAQEAFKLLAAALSNKNNAKVTQANVKLMTESYNELKGWLPTLRTVSSLAKKYYQDN